MRTVAILPVKSFPRAKQRLGGGLSPADRRRLAEAMVHDVLRALAATPGLDQVIVVTREPAARAVASRYGARVLEDSEAGHNAAARLGIVAALEEGAERVLLVPGDCPVLDPAELAGLLTRPADAPSALIVPDRHGTGTNALLLHPPAALEPSFGPGSCERHSRDAREAGVRAEVVAVASLAMDVDTPDDLRALEARLRSEARLGRATRNLLDRLAVSPQC